MREDLLTLVDYIWRSTDRNSVDAKVQEFLYKYNEEPVGLNITTEGEPEVTLIEEPDDIEPPQEEDEELEEDDDTDEVS